VATNPEIIALLEREAAAEREQILAEARAEADRIRADARRQAEEYLAATRGRLEAEGKAALVKAQSTAQLRASALVLQAKEEELTRVFARAQDDLAAFARDTQRYPAALQAFIEEGLTGISGHAVVTVNPADQAAAESLARTRGWDVTIQTDPAVRGGGQISSPGGRFVVTNTLASRLERARPALAAEVAKILWE
jgi:vacuolar-type H+-ATPase subunit E/Vma4